MSPHQTDQLPTLTSDSLACDAPHTFPRHTAFDVVGEPIESAGADGKHGVLAEGHLCFVGLPDEVVEFDTVRLTAVNHARLLQCQPFFFTHLVERSPTVQPIRSAVEIPANHVVGGLDGEAYE
jgi:hypothetical protein